MRLKHLFLIHFCAIILIAVNFKVSAQDVKWSKDGTSYYLMGNGEITSVTLPKNDRKTIVSRQLLSSTGKAINDIKDFESLRNSFNKFE